MTLVECFDRSVANNIVSCLRFRPDQVVFLGVEEEMQAPLKRLRSFFSAKGIDTKVQGCHVDLRDIPGITQKLLALVGETDNCIIDITGGDERILLAVGAMLAGLDEQQRQRVSVHKFDADTGTFCDFSGPDRQLPEKAGNLSVAELIALHGGIVFPSTHQPEAYWTVEDMEPLWRIAAQDPTQWNRKLSVLAEFESWADSLQQVFIMLQFVQGRMAGYTDKRARLADLLRQFRESGVITDLSRNGILEYTYTTELNRMCTLKAGNILEVKALLEARRMQKDGKPFFHDCVMGVQIDWDGVVHDAQQHIPETHNEIDLILMQGMTPLFVSCKNGDVDESELYKLHTVATRFGGQRARKMLIVSQLVKKNQASAAAFAQRAADMGIYLVPDASEFTAEDWQEAFQKAML